MAVEAYNIDKNLEPKMTIEELKKAYAEKNDAFSSYEEWFHDTGEMQAIEILTKICDEKDVDIDGLRNMDFDELKKYMENR